MKSSFVIYFGFFLSITVSAQKPVPVSSPDGSLVFSLTVKKGNASYRITYKGTVVVDDSPFSIETDDGTFGKNVSLQKNSATTRH